MSTKRMFIRKQIMRELWGGSIRHESNRPEYQKPASVACYYMNTSHITTDWYRLSPLISDPE